MMHLAREGARVDQLLRVDAGGGRASDIANVVRAGAAVEDAKVGQSHQDIGRIAGADLANLKVRARRYVGVAPAVRLGEVRHAAKLPRIDDAARKAKPAHIAILRRGDVEHAQRLHQEHVRALGKLAGFRTALHLIPQIERILLALGGLFLGQFLSGVGDPILRLEMNRFRPGWQRRLGARRLALGLGLIARTGIRTVQSRADRKASEVLLLLFGKVFVGHDLDSTPYES